MEKVVKFEYNMEKNLEEVPGDQARKRKSTGGPNDKQEKKKKRLVYSKNLLPI